MGFSENSVARNSLGGTYIVMAGLVPAIHSFVSLRLLDVDARHKAGHDESEFSADD
jgi:hypothetical protein